MLSVLMLNEMRSFSAKSRVIEISAFRQKSMFSGLKHLTLHGKCGRYD